MILFVTPWFYVRDNCPHINGLMFEYYFTNTMDYK